MTTSIQNDASGSPQLASSGDDIFRTNPLFDNITVATLEADETGKVFAVSPGWGSFTGQNPEQSTAAGWINAVHPSDENTVRSSWNAAVKSQVATSFQFRLRTIHGDFKWCELRLLPMLNENGAVCRWVAMIFDVHAHMERARAESELRKSEQKYRSLFENVGQGFCIIEMINDENGNAVDYSFLEANPTFSRQTGLTNVVGKTAKELVPNLEQRWIDFYASVARTGTPTNFADKVEGLDERIYEVFAFPFTEGSENQVAVLFNDITVRKHHENRQEFLFELSEMLRPVSDPIVIEEVVTLAAMRYFSADRCYYSALSNGQATVSRDAAGPGLQSVAGTYALDEMPVFKSVIEKGRPFAVEDVRASNLVDENLRQMCIALEVISFMNIPVIKGGSPVGILSVVKKQPYEWSLQEIRLAEDIAERIWTAVERVQSEAALRKSERLRAAMLDIIPLGLGLLAPEGELLLSNPEFDRYLPNNRIPSLDEDSRWRWESRDANGSLIAPENFPGARALRGERVDRGVEFLFTDQDGTKIWTNVSAIPFTHENGAIAGAVVIINDINEYKKAKHQLQEFNQRLEQQVADRTAELAESKDFLQAIIDSSQDMIQVFKAIRDDKGKIVDFKWILNNKISEDLYGNVGNRTLLENNPGVVPTGIFDAFVEVVETGIPQQYEKHYALEQFDGWFQQSVVKFDDGVATSTADITTRKLAELEVHSLNRELIKKNSALESLSLELQTFTNIAANDYQRTLHNLYVNFEEILKRDAMKLSDSGKASIRRTQSGIQKLKLLTEDIINFLNLSPLGQQTSEIDLNTVVDNALVELHSKYADKNAAVEIPEPLPVVKGYPLLLAVLFRHLLDNALKFSNEGEPVRVEIGYRLMSAKDISKPMPHDLYHEISIRDNGIGFDNKYSEELFKIFYRHHQSFKGPGVGLAMCRKIMALHEGFMKARGIPGNGAVFYCCFPA